MNNESGRRERLMESDAAHYIGMSVPWMRTQRMKRRGPSFLKIGHSVRYDIADLDAWMDSQRVRCA